MEEAFIIKEKCPIKITMEKLLSIYSGLSSYWNICFMREISSVNIIVIIIIIIITHVFFCWKTSVFLSGNSFFERQPYQTIMYKWFKIKK